MSIMNIYFLELFVHMEAILNAIFSLTVRIFDYFLTVSSVLDGFCSTKVCRHSNRDHGCLSRVFRGPKYKGVSLCIEFSKTYALSNSAGTIRGRVERGRAYDGIKDGR
jgi:hypothetical protein